MFQPIYFVFIYNRPMTHFNLGCSVPLNSHIHNVFHFSLNLLESQFINETLVVIVKYWKTNLFFSFIWSDFIIAWTIIMLIFFSLTSEIFICSQQLINIYPPLANLFIYKSWLTWINGIECWILWVSVNIRNKGRWNSLSFFESKSLEHE